MKKVLIALIGIIPACLTAVFGYVQGIKTTPAYRAELELQGKRIQLDKGPNPNFRQLVYPNYGLSLQAPVAWSVEDGPARLAGGEFNLVSRYEDTKAAIGMNFRLRPVQPNYINDLATQVQNQIDLFQKQYSTVVVSDKSISGAAAKQFEYVAPTGLRNMTVKMYWLRLAPDVQLQILCAQYTDAQDKDEFWRDAERVISSIVVAFDAWQARYTTSPGA